MMNPTEDRVYLTMKCFLIVKRSLPKQFTTDAVGGGGGGRIGGCYSARTGLNTASLPMTGTRLAVLWL
jgi:hypothetical protein